LSAVESTLVCQGCGYRVPSDVEPPFACPQAVVGDDVDHALRRELRIGEGGRQSLAALFGRPEPNPFLRYRELLHSYGLACERGLSDADFVALVGELDAAVAEQRGAGLEATPCEEYPKLASALGSARAWVKDETGNVGGTHKGRHLVGLLIWLLVRERMLGEGDSGRRTLAISSCGNAALAASIAARSVDWPIEVFVPPDANPYILDRLRNLEASVAPCERRPGELGDPCYLRFLERLAEGALPFTCQGPSNGLVIEGGQTLIWEMASTLLASGTSIDRLFIQTGGGALATACVQGWREASRLVDLGPLPALHPVQTTSVTPLVRAYDRVAERIAERHLGGGGLEATPAGRSRLAARMKELPDEVVQAELTYAARHRSEFMWPSDGDVDSLADAILDDETYDWLPVVSGLLESGGFPIVAGEAPIQVGNTGSAGLAGALELAAAGLVTPHERLGLLFTGVRWSTR
jgi:hypothetical protein